MARYQMSFPSRFDSKKQVLFIAGCNAIQIQKMFKENGIDFVCSQLVGDGTVTILGELASIAKKPVDELLYEKKLMFYWLNARNHMLMLLNQFSLIFDPNLNCIYGAPIIGTNDMTKIMNHLSDDMTVFSLWCIIHGATSESVRNVVNRSDIKRISALEKSHGHDIFFTILTRACAAFLSLSDRVVLPACDKLMRGQYNKKINTMGNAFAGLKSA